MEDKLKDLCYIEDAYISWAKNQIANGSNRLKREELDSIADAIKDISEAKKHCCEAQYYEAVVKAMEESEDEREYYQPGYRMGYRPPMYYGSLNTAYSNDTTAPFMNNAWRMQNDISDDTSGKRNGMSDPDAERYGRVYSDWKRAKRNYTATHNETDRAEMEVEGMKHLVNVIASLREMWEDADPQLRQRMKTDLTTLMAEMNK